MTPPTLAEIRATRVALERCAPHVEGPHTAECEAGDDLCTVMVEQIDGQAAADEAWHMGGAA